MVFQPHLWVWALSTSPVVLKVTEGKAWLLPLFLLDVSRPEPQLQPGAGSVHKDWSSRCCANHLSP